MTVILIPICRGLLVFKTGTLGYHGAAATNRKAETRHLDPWIRWLSVLVVRRRPKIPHSVFDQWSTFFDLLLSS